MIGEGKFFSLASPPIYSLQFVPHFNENLQCEMFSINATILFKVSTLQFHLKTEYVTRETSRKPLVATSSVLHKTNPAQKLVQK